MLRGVELRGARRDVRVVDGIVAAIAPALRTRPDDEVVSGDGGALIAGLHDHHLHVLATAAARASVAVGPSDTPNRTAFAAALEHAARRGAVRAVGYHERVAGPLDRDALDRIVADVPVRVQHRTGTLWVLNSRALDALGALGDERLSDPRVERDGSGRASGRLWRADDLVRTDAELPPVGDVGRELARHGVTAITDATASNDGTTAAALGALPQRVRVMGPIDLAAPTDRCSTLGEVKVLLDDDALPPLDDAIELIHAAHACGRAAAFHCVTLVQLRLAIEALRAAGVVRDRIEHASVALPDAIVDLRALGVTVTTQPGFIAARGDDYLRDVDGRDRDHLYPIASLRRAGVPTLGSSDAPYGPLDPWCAMRAAVDRRSASGAIVGADERIDAAAALGLFGGNRTVEVGGRADLVLLAGSLGDVLKRLDARDVRATIIGGEVAYDAS